MTRQSHEAQRALALHKAGDPAGAEKIYRRLLKSEPGLARVRYLLGVACLEQGKFAAGRVALDQALRRSPEDPDILYSLGRAWQALGEPEKGLRYLQAARDLAPQRADVWAAIGDVLRQLNQSLQALQAYDRALELKPDDWRICANAAVVRINTGNIHDGAVILRRLSVDHRHPTVLLNLALAEQALGNFEHADTILEELVASEPDNVDAQAARALHFRQNGEIDRAWDLVRTFDEASLRRCLPVLAFAKIAPLHEEGSQSLTRQSCGYIETLVGDPATAAHDRALLYFALAQARDRLGECDAAFDAVSAGSALAPVSYDRVTLERRFANLRAFFTAERFAGLARATRISERPVFIVGMPRSGTSLVEQILASHPDAAGAGELSEIPSIEHAIGAHAAPQRLADLQSADLDPYADRYLRRLDQCDARAARVSDKLPANFERLGLISLLFPGARVLHCVRDPLDTCLSCFFQDFRFRIGYSFSLEHLGHYYACYTALMDHWRSVLPVPMLDICYETLVEDPTTTVAGMLEFCGLQWDDRCLAFHETRRTVNTASVDQVRRPLYTSSIDRSARYMHRLQPLLDSFAAHGVDPGRHRLPPAR